MLSENPRVFISYARKDGEDFARDLYQELQERNILVWMDRFDMYGGHGWWKQIQESLDKVSFLVLVSTDAAMRSAVVEKEWRYARQNGICVFPIIPPEQDLNFELFPLLLTNPDARMLIHGIWNDSPTVVAYNNEILGLGAELAQGKMQHEHGVLSFNPKAGLIPRSLLRPDGFAEGEPSDKMEI